MQIESLIEPLPDGKKRAYINEVYMQGLTKYIALYDEELDLNEIIVKEFQNILNDNKNNLIEDLRLFSEVQLLKIVDFKPLKDSQIRKALNKFFNFEIQVSKKKKKNYLPATRCETTLHDFQERIRRKAINFIFSENKNRFLIHMPTGSGKTRTACEIIIDFIRFSSSFSLLNNNIKILWVAQSEELCEQASDTFNYLYNKKGTTNLSIGRFYSDNEIDNDIINDSAIIFTSIQKLLINYQTPIWQEIQRNNYLVVVDEAHRSTASEWVKALDFFVNNSNVNLIGLTATPGTGSIDSSNNHYLSTYYANNKISLMNENYAEIDKPINYLTEKEFLANIVREQIDSDTTVLEDVQLNGEKFEIKKVTLNNLSIDAKRNQTIVNLIKKHVEKNHKILIFSCGVQHNKILKKCLDLEGINSEFINAQTENRQYIINKFKNENDDLQVLLNYGVLTTGFDAPKTNVCIIARPIESIVMYSQMVGRILRGPKNGMGNKENFLYTIKDNLNHGDYDNLFNSFNDFWN